MYNNNKAQQSKNRVHISWGILYLSSHNEDYFMVNYVFLIRIHISSRQISCSSFWGKEVIFRAIILQLFYNLRWWYRNIQLKAKPKYNCLSFVYISPPNWREFSMPWFYEKNYACIDIITIIMCVDLMVGWPTNHLSQWFCHCKQMR